ncbi:hypothetical protein [Salipaludibacillus sp. CF4.18]|uniref:hypothetical protein n=1 Tax=Salipaludibacillus sp. CF4.18 TaxID=3373081 RepID=UPI003EE720D7
MKDSLVEDIHITRNINKRGYKALLVNNTNTVRCYMYNTSKVVWDGFSKNLFPGLGRNPFLVVILILFYFGFFVMPLPFAIWGIVTANYMWVLPFICSIIIKGIVDFMTHQKKWLCFFIPFSAMGMITLLCFSTYLGIFKRGFSWKGRTYQ